MIKDEVLITQSKYHGDQVFLKKPRASFASRLRPPVFPSGVDFTHAYRDLSWPESRDRHRLQDGLAGVAAG